VAVALRLRRWKCETAGRREQFQRKPQHLEGAIRTAAATLADLAALSQPVLMNLKETTQNVCAISRQIKAATDDASGRAHRQLARADQTLGEILTAVEGANRRWLAGPLTEVSAAAAGVRAAVRAFSAHRPDSRSHRQRNTPRAGLIVAFLVSISCSTVSRCAQQAPPQLYEGLKVSSVDLVARPMMNVEVFRPLVAQKAETPYSAAEIQKTVAALQETGQFSRVEVEVKPEAEGLRVTFIMEPVFYVGMIYFPGATKVFSYPRLLEVVNYPAQEPYEAARAGEGETSLTRFFAQQGYFAARVKVGTKLDQARKLVDIVYDGTLSRRAKFGTVQINGPPPAEIARLKGALRSFRAQLHGANLKEGKPYDPVRLQAATRFLQDFLGTQNHFANSVRLEPPIYDPETNRAALHWQVALGPTVLVRVTGARISKRALHTLIPIYEENAFDQDLVEEGKRNLVSYFQGKGYFDVKVSPQTSDEPSQISLVYQVDRGNRHRVTSVRITGNNHFDEGHLADQVVIQKAHFFSHGKFSNDLLSRSVKNLTVYYRDAGYQDVQVQPQVIDHEAKVDVTFRITEGELTRVETLDVEGNTSQTLARLAPDGLNLKPGQPYSQSRLDEDRNQIIATYLDLGYPNATLRSTVKPDAGGSQRVAVTYLIDEGTQARVSDVAFLGGAHTRQPFLQRNTSVQAGAPLSEAKLLGSESSLDNLGIFDWASVAPRRPITDQKTEDVLVKVHEAKRNSITYGLGLQYTPVSGSLSSGIVALPGLPTIGLPTSFQIIENNVLSPLGSIEYSRLNLRGRAETASIATFLSILDQRGSFSYTDPQFPGLNWSSLLSVSAERTTQNPLFTARLGTASFQMEKVLDAAKTKRWQFRYTFQRTTLTNLLILNLIPPEDQSVRSSMLSTSFIRDTRDKSLDAHRGVFQTLDLGISPKLIGSSDNFARFFGQSAYYRQVKPWMVWANNVRLGFVESFGGSHVPISERFFSGGADSLRGFPLNGAGPQAMATLCTKVNDPATCTAHITVPTGGHELFIFNSEGRFPIPLKKGLGGVVFYDGGNVYKRVGFSRFFTDYSNTVGFGLRYQTPVGPVRIDVGRNLNRVSGLSSTQLFVTLGQSF
jgi:outer membrane protein insertion porin family